MKQNAYIQSPHDQINQDEDSEFDSAILWPLNQVLKQFPVSRSLWLAGVRDGKYPQPIRLSKRRIAWRPNDIHALVQTLALKQGLISNLIFPVASVAKTNKAKLDLEKNERPQ